MPWGGKHSHNYQARAQQKAFIKARMVWNRAQAKVFYQGQAVATRVMQKWGLAVSLGWDTRL